jgi:hypothetical protein
MLWEILNYNFEIDYLLDTRNHIQDGLSCFLDYKELLVHTLKLQIMIYQLVLLIFLELDKKDS